MSDLRKYEICALSFEPQDDIVGFLRMAERQNNRGLELTCPFKFLECDDVNLSAKDLICDNVYTNCKIYQRLMEGRK